MLFRRLQELSYISYSNTLAFLSIIFVSAMKENRRTARPLKKNSNFEDYRLSEKIRHLLQFKKKLL